MLTLAVGIFLLWASSDIDSGVYVKTFCKGADDRRCVSLTFDDGPHPKYTEEILNIFMVERKLPEFAEKVIGICKRGNIHTVIIR